MAVENPVYINEFNEAWPDGLDSKSQGDDHIRNIKAAIKRTFPKITGPSNVTQSDLNKLITAGTTNVPGMVMMWPYELGSIPAGWKVCNGVGAISTGRPVPNLIDRFVVGAGSSYAIQQTGGNAFITPTGAVAGHALTEAQMPSHTHRVGVNITTPDGLDNVGGEGEPRPVTNFPGGYNNYNSEFKGGNQPHAHGLTMNAIDVRPPFYAIWYIIKD